MTKVILHSEAEDEFLDVVRFYAERSRRIGTEFAEQLREGIDFITMHPTGSPVLRGDVRKKVLRKFPYSIVYSIEPDQFVILAIMRHERRPGYWLHRQRFTDG